MELDSSQYLSRADNASLSPTGNISISAWGRFESLAAGALPTFMQKSNNTGNQRGFLLRYDVDGAVLSFINSSDGIATTTGSVAWSPSTATWYHVVARYNASAGTVRFDVGNVQQGTTQSGLATSIFDNTATFLIGAGNEGTGNFFDGMIDEVVLTSDLLTDAEVTDLFNGFDASLISLDNVAGYWKLNNGLTDESANANTLTNNGTAVFSTTVPFANYATRATKGFPYLIY